MKQVLYQRLLEIAKGDFVRLHYPGHKGRNLYFDPSLLGQLDQTEIHGTDDLQAPEDVILRSQTMAAKLYGVKASFYGVGGSTMANYAAIGAASQPGDTVLIQRNSHRSVYQAAMLQDLKVLTIHPDYDDNFALLTGISLKNLEDTLSSHPEIKLAVFTNPSYYGLCLNLKEIVDLCHKHEVTVIVDEAHGAHLNFTKDHHLSAIACGADLVVHSAHKSLPAMTSTSLLHLNSDRVDQARLRKFFNLYTNSSPSYVLLTSIEAALTEMAAHGVEKYKELEIIRKEAAKKLEEVGAQVYKVDEEAHLAGYDFTKLFFKVPGYTGEKLLEALHEEKVELELADARAVLAVLSTETTTRDLDRLVQGVRNLPKARMEEKDSIYKKTKTHQVTSLRSAFYSEDEWVDLEASEGRVVVDFLQVYPPGIPILIPGEVMTGEIIDLIKDQEIIGMSHGKLRVIK